WRLHHQPAAGRGPRRTGLGRVRLRRRSPRPRARRSCATARASPLLLEERQMGARTGHAQPERPRILGAVRLRPARRSVAGGALRVNTSSGGWLPGTLVDAVPLTDSARSLAFQVPGWPGNDAGQHVDIRLSAPDGYQAVRSYSIATAGPGDELELAVERLPGGEVTPSLAAEIETGDAVPLPGPPRTCVIRPPAQA